MHYSFTGTVWKYQGKAAWYFINLPTTYTKELKSLHGPYKLGFGSIRVQATIGTETWQTSIFPDSKSGSYMLPVKKEVRQKAELQEGAAVPVVITLIDV